QYYFNPAVGVGNHTITYTWTNPNGYSASCNFIATVNNIPQFTITGTQNPTCHDGSDGSIAILISSGVPDYSINWGSGSATTNLTNYTISNLPSGNYNIVVSDFNGCSFQAGTTLVNPPAMVSTISVTSDYNGQDISCNGESDGSAEVVVSGGIGPYTYTWSVSAGSQNSQEAINLPAGMHSVTVEDVNGCQVFASIVLSEPAAINANVVINNHVLCNGESNASVNSTVSGGTLPYTYTWNYDNSHLSYHNQLPAGTWTLIVSDANGCTANEQFVITEPNILDVQFINVQNVSCYGDSDGAAIAQPSGGTGPYTYLWDDPNHSNQATASNLPVGVYHVTITDANGCTVSDFINITQPEPLAVTTSSQPVQCGISLGSVSANVVGGTLPYQYNWTGGHTGQQVSGLIAGTYYVTVQDAHGCTIESVVYVGMQGNGVVHITETQPILCNGESNAILTADMINGIAPVAYLWSTSATGASVQNLPAGIYSVTATDSWGCSGSQSHMITQPSIIVLNMVSTPVSCYGGNNGTATVTAAGGSSPYTYFWSNGGTTANLTDLTAGNYVLTLTDSHNCEMIGNVVVNQPENPVTVSMVIGNISCFGEHDGSVSLNVSGGTAPYAYEWHFDTFTTTDMNINNLYEGIYDLTVTDANSCVVDTFAVVSQPAPLAASYVATGPSCIGNWDGYIEIAATGGTEPYQYVWSQGISPVEFITGLVEGEYMITVVDARGCQQEIGPVTLTDFPVDCIKIPNAFTPNGDGINDTWIIDHIEMFPSAYIQVYNRWGQALFEAKGSE
ncbi:MAG TPA: gliding motility-associated C-terminal domain-containing protein, partial [Bacteroidales bacterium]|nr:gliding motility-associated C-terminal domain-containing protein [Bacteroidales bacterium]